MRILYVSYLPETMSGGPKYSVPHQIDSQSLLDDVCWINMTNVEMIDSRVKPISILDWKIVVCKIKEYNPDFVVFEDLYYLPFCLIASKLRKNHIPYVIIPRGSMTSFAQKKKAIKKFVGNFLFFNRFIKKSLAVEFLNNGEKESIAKQWKNVKSIIIPNGITKLANNSSYERFTNETIKGVFVGRIDVFHKGIDVFLEACSSLKCYLLENKCFFEFYGPCDKKNKSYITEYIERNGLNNIVSVYDEIHGNEKDKLLINSDFFVLTSRFEGMPMGLLEALSYGLPCIITYGTNMGHEVISSEAGFCSLCETGGIKKSLVSLLNLKKDKLNRMSENAKKLANEYRWEEIARKAHNCYSALLGLK